MATWVRKISNEIIMYVHPRKPRVVALRYSTPVWLFPQTVSESSQPIQL